MPTPEQLPPKFDIQKGVPIPPDLLKHNSTGGHTPVYPWRDMDKGDYLEVYVQDNDTKNKVLVSLRNARKSRPTWVWVWRYGKSELPENADSNKVYIKVWRSK